MTSRTDTAALLRKLSEAAQQGWIAANGRHEPYSGLQHFADLVFDMARDYERDGVAQAASGDGMAAGGSAPKADSVESSPRPAPSPTISDRADYYGRLPDGALLICRESDAVCRRQCHQMGPCAIEQDRAARPEGERAGRADEATLEDASDGASAPGARTPQSDGSLAHPTPGCAIWLYMTNQTETGPSETERVQVWLPFGDLLLDGRKGPRHPHDGITVTPMKHFNNRPVGGEARPEKAEERGGISIGDDAAASAPPPGAKALEHQMAVGCLYWAGIIKQFAPGSSEQLLKAAAELTRQHGEIADLRHYRLEAQEMYDASLKRTCVDRDKAEARCAALQKVVDAASELVGSFSLVTSPLVAALDALPKDSAVSK